MKLLGALFLAGAGLGGAAFLVGISWWMRTWDQGASLPPLGLLTGGALVLLCLWGAYRLLQSWRDDRNGRPRDYRSSPGLAPGSNPLADPATPDRPLTPGEKMTADINRRLERFCDEVGEESLNYAADIQLFPSPGMAGRNIAEIVSAALGVTVVVGGSSSTDRVEILQALRHGLEYAGNDGSFANRTFLASARCQTEKAEVLKFFEAFTADADLLASFWLKSGHPFYPVYWDFAFVIEKGADAFVLIGSSSD